MSSQNANSVAITGGTINGVSGTNASMTVGNATNATNATFATTAGTANAVAYANVTGKPGTGLYLLYSGAVSCGNLGGTGVGSVTHIWQMLFNGAQATETISPDSFTIVTSLNDYYSSAHVGVL
jgi:hypothetical protein